MMVLFAFPSKHRNEGLFPSVSIRSDDQSRISYRIQQSQLPKANSSSRHEMFSTRDSSQITFINTRTSARRQLILKAFRRTQILVESIYYYSDRRKIHRSLPRTNTHTQTYMLREHTN